MDGIDYAIHSASGRLVNRATRFICGYYEPVVRLAGHR
jgi:hypothetical protein